MTSPKVECPGCHGTKTKRAVVCAACRSFATEIGIQAVLAERKARPTDAENLQRFDRMRRAYHGKCDAIGKELGESKLSIKQGILVRASEQFKRPIASFDDCTLLEAGWILDRLEEQLDAFELAGAE
jgi:hypothetical protein